MLTLGWVGKCKEEEGLDDRTEEGGTTGHSPRTEEGVERAKGGSKSVPGDGPEDDGEDGDDDGREEDNPERAAEEEFSDVGFADADRSEGGLEGGKGGLGRAGEGEVGWTQRFRRGP